MLEFIQRHYLACLGDELRVKLEFSFGCVMAKGEADHRELLKHACLSTAFYVGKIFSAKNAPHSNGYCTDAFTFS